MPSSRINGRLPWFALLLGLVVSLSTLTAPAQNTGAGRSRTSSSSSIYPGSTEIGGATVTYDQETRKLIVIADEETAAYVSQVVTNLDRPAPQVLIKVVFLEVTYRNGMDLGVEGSMQKDAGNGNVANLAQSFNGLPGINSGSGLYQLAGSEFQVTLRAIAEAGKLEVLSRPTILARNNQEATITVGQQVPLITNVRYDNFGNQINAITYQSVGIILRVTPFITSGGMVEMIVSPEISNLSDQTVAISTGTNSVGAPVINTRSADTVVITPDNQTVVIGGLMQNSKTSSTSKIPFLGDIPGLGALFRRKVTSDVKTELLIFLTPQIVKHPSLLTSVTAKEQANQQITPQAFSQEDLDRFLRDLPPKSPEPKKKRRSRSTSSE